jgi:hypothetical protein
MKLVKMARTHELFRWLCCWKMCSIHTSFVKNTANSIYQNISSLKYRSWIPRQEYLNRTLYIYLLFSSKQQTNYTFLWLIFPLSLQHSLRMSWSSRHISTISLSLSLMEWDWVHLVLQPLFGLLYQPQMIHDNDCGAVGRMIKRKYSEKTCPSATLSTTNPAWFDSGSNTGRLGG